MIHLHVHSHYSLKDSIIRIPDLVKRVKELNMPTVAITEHGNINSWVTLKSECKKYNVKPIYGIEMYCCHDTNDKKTYHITLLAKNNDGIREIIQLHNISTLKQIKQFPRITFNQILDCKNIIVLSGCMSSYLSECILNKEYDKAFTWCAEFQKSFNDDFYLEVQDMQLAEQNTINQRLKDFPIQKVITNDVHYLNPEDRITHHIFQCSKYHKDINSEMLSPHIWLKPDIEVKIGSVLGKILNTDTTYEIADKCGGTIKKYQNTLPNIGKHLFVKDRITNKEQIKSEYNIIKESGYWPYLCTVSHYVSWAKRNGIAVGHSRGSVAGSLLAYSMNIHDVNPLDYGLYFSRFYNKGRKQSMPDIDTDFSQSGIKQVKAYLQTKCNVAAMGTYGQLGASASIKLVTRTYNVDFKESNEITKRYKDYELQDIPLNELNEDWRKYIEHAKKLYGLYEKYGTHASGCILTNVDIETEIPLRYNNNNELQTCWDMEHLESLGFIKFDLLKIKTLDIVEQTINLADISFDDINYQDQKTFDLMCSGKNVGIFQLSGSEGMNNLTKNIKPRTIRDIADVIALYRPGPLQNNFHTEYIACRNGKIPTYSHDFLRPILQDTFGLIIYQEQVIAICMAVGFSEEEADIIRKAMGKKKDKLFNSMKKRFIELCSAKIGTYAKELWDQIVRNSGYTFNLAHAVGYAHIVYTTAYLKANYPLEFYTACLNNCDNPSEIQEFITDMKPIKILPPRFNKSRMSFEIDNMETITETSAIRYGLRGIYGIGDAEAEKILECESINDIRNKKMCEILIKGGYFDEVEPNRKLLLSSDNINQINLLSPKDFNDTEKKQFEFEMLHVYLEDNPLTQYNTNGLYLDNEYIHGCLSPFVVTNVQIKLNKKQKPYAIIDTININNKPNTFLIFSNVYHEIMRNLSDKQIEVNKHYIFKLESYESRWHIVYAQKL